MQLDGYKLKQPLGKGGMATVYLGEQLSLSRPVAIKVLDAALIDDPVVQSQFQQESLLVATLNHPNIIQVIDQGQSESGLPYFVMQYVKSVNLGSVLSRDDVALTRKLDIVIQICKALSYAHKNGVVHRDIKPANILVDYEGHVRVVDFGIAGYFAQQTDDTVVMGTPAYMPPEQAHGGVVTAQSDLYSLGVLMYELFYGGRPGEVSSSSGIPEALSQLIDDCLSREPAFRPKSADDISQSLLLILQGKHLVNKRWDAEQAADSIPAGYKLLDVLKENDYGATYLVSDPKRKRFLVIKKQKLAYAGDAYSVNKRLTGIEHDNIAKVYGTAKNNRVFITVVEYVNGGSLEERLTQAFPLAHWLLLAQQICEALNFIHAKGIVHGNLRPSNILLFAPAQIKLTDFGFTDHSDKERDWYQPPTEEKSPLSDIFSAGAVLFHLFTGKPVELKGEGVSNFEELSILPEPLQRVLLKMLALDTGKRYQNIIKVKQALQSFNDEQETLIIRPKKQSDKSGGLKEVPKARPKRKLWQGVSILLVVVLLVVAELIWVGSEGYLGENFQNIVLPVKQFLLDYFYAL